MRVMSLTELAEELRELADDADAGSREWPEDIRSVFQQAAVDLHMLAHRLEMACKDVK